MTLRQLLLMWAREAGYRGPIRLELVGQAEQLQATMGETVRTESIGDAMLYLLRRSSPRTVSWKELSGEDA